MLTSSRYWEPVPGNPGFWTNTVTGETIDWRRWRDYGERGGHFPARPSSRRAHKAIGQVNAERARAAETRYAIQLRAVARNVGQIVNGIFDPFNPDNPGWHLIVEALHRYSELIRPWAESVAARMLTDVSRRDLMGWHNLGKEISAGLRQAAETAPLHDPFQQLQNQQVELITSIPRDAAQRVHGLSQEAMVAGSRWEDIARSVREQHGVSQSKANTIARTETARASSNFQATRAQHIGCETFFWRTANDRDVRHLHRNLARGLDNNGNATGLGAGAYRYDDPPLLDDGRPGLPGTIYNCRCYAEPILPQLPA